MEKYAVIQLSGKQYLVRNGDVFEVERQEKQPKFDVLVYFDGKKHQIGEPALKDTSIKVTNEEDKRGKKIRVVRFKSKSRYRKVKGHKQPLSVLKVSFGGAEKAEAKKATKAKKSSPKKKVTKKAK